MQKTDLGSLVPLVQIEGADVSDRKCVAANKASEKKTRYEIADEIFDTAYYCISVWSMKTWAGWVDLF